MKQPNLTISMPNMKGKTERERTPTYQNHKAKRHTFFCCLFCSCSTLNANNNKMGLGIHQYVSLSACQLVSMMIT